MDTVQRSAVRGLPSALARWRGLCVDEQWLSVVRRLERHVGKLTGATRSAVWARIPPHGDWLHVAWGREPRQVHVLPPGAWPLSAVVEHPRPLRHDVGGGSELARIMAQESIAATWVLPLIPPSPGLVPLKPTGVLALGWRDTPPDGPPTVADLLPVIAHLVDERTQGALTDAFVTWSRAQPVPSTPQEWTARLQALQDWLGADHWVLLRVSDEGRGSWQVDAQFGRDPEVGAHWLEFTGQDPQWLQHTTVIRAMTQQRIGFQPDVDAYAGGSRQEPASFREMARKLRICSLIAVPLGSQPSGDAGVVVVTWEHTDGWRRAGLSVHPLEALRRVLADAWHHMALTRDLLRDSLTGVLNRRGIEAAWCATCADGVVGLVDLDDFHRVNNTWGHLMGDEVLRTIAGILAAEARDQGGWCGRWGGDEFALGLAPGVAWEALGTRIQDRLDDTSRQRGWPQRITVSGGSWAWQGESPLWVEALERADRALLQAKRRGGATFIPGENAGEQVLPLV